MHIDPIRVDDLTVQDFLSLTDWIDHHQAQGKAAAAAASKGR